MTTILVDAEAKRDVLARIVMLFHRRAIVVPSLSMAPAEFPGIIRVIIAVDADRDQTERLVADLYKLVNILSVETVT